MIDTYSVPAMSPAKQIYTVPDPYETGRQIRRSKVAGKAQTGMHSGKINVDSPIEFGKIYRDTITGFKGKAIGLTRWITGCDQIALSPGMDKDGEKMLDTKWFDDGRLVLVEQERQLASSGKGAAGEPAAERVTG